MYERRGHVSIKEDWHIMKRGPAYIETVSYTHLPAQVIRQKRPFEPDGTIGQSRPLCFPPRFNRMGYPKRLVRRRSFHE